MTRTVVSRNNFQVNDILLANKFRPLLVKLSYLMVVSFIKMYIKLIYNVS